MRLSLAFITLALFMFTDCKKTVSENDTNNSNSKGAGKVIVSLFKDLISNVRLSALPTEELYPTISRYMRELEGSTETLDFLRDVKSGTKSLDFDAFKSSFSKSKSFLTENMNLLDQTYVDDILRNADIDPRMAEDLISVNLTSKVIQNHLDTVNNTMNDLRKIGGESQQALTQAMKNHAEFADDLIGKLWNQMHIKALLEVEINAFVDGLKLDESIASVAKTQFKNSLTSVGVAQGSLFETVGAAVPEPSHVYKRLASLLDDYVGLLSRNSGRILNGTFGEISNLNGLKAKDFLRSFENYLPGQQISFGLPNGTDFIGSVVSAGKSSSDAFAAKVLRKSDNRFFDIFLNTNYKPAKLVLYRGKETMDIMEEGLDMVGAQAR